MKGNIKAYSSSVNAGFIIGADSKSYQFTKGAFLHPTLPENGLSVTFEEHGNKALNIEAS